MTLTIFNPFKNFSLKAIDPGLPCNPTSYVMYLLWNDNGDKMIQL